MCAAPVVIALPAGFVAGIAGRSVRRLQAGIEMDF
jgi:hypothetical protein